ncbi:hypothetical protein [Bacillus mycoides]|uniref:hypothetical protein n=1 Tax=Bacillus mycoides TaxID=1405 RepID=UPI0011A1982C|nr:hypothetical protein [Bacillus mycoides]
MKIESVGKFGRIVHGTLEETYENLFRLTVINKGKEGQITIDTSDLPYELYCGVFTDEYEELNSAQKMQLEYDIRKYIKRVQLSVKQ